MSYDDLAYDDSLKSADNLTRLIDSGDDMRTERREG